RMAAGLPSQEVVAETWSGIGFRLAGQPMIASLGEISESLHEPRYTALPRVKPWVRGVANVRGRLLPIIDLSQVFGATSSATRKQRRVRARDRDAIFVGRLGVELLGMQHFPVSSCTTPVPDLQQQCRPSVVRAYTGEQVSMIFHFPAFARDQ